MPHPSMQQMKGCCPKLTYKQRLCKWNLSQLRQLLPGDLFFYDSWCSNAYTGGCGICMATGIGITVLGYLMIMSSNYVAFAVLYTLGNLVALGATSFFTGEYHAIPCQYHTITPTPAQYSYHNSIPNVLQWPHKSLWLDFTMIVAHILGPAKQFKNMCKNKRWIATTIYFSAMVLY